MRTGRLAGRDEPAGEAGARDVPRRRGLSGERVRRGPGAGALYSLTGIFSAPVPKGRA